MFLKAGALAHFHADPKPPGLHTTTRELQLCTFKGPGASNTTKIPREDPREREKARKWGREMEKKARNFGPPAFGPPPFEPPRCGATLRTPTLGALTFSRSGPHPSGPPTLQAPIPPGSTLRPPSLRAEALRASTFSGFGPLRSSF